MSTISIPHILKDCYQTFLHAILEFCILTFSECDRTEALVWLEHLGVTQRRVSMTIIASIVKLDVLTLWTALLSWVLVVPCSTVKSHPAWSLVIEPSA